MPVGRPPGRRPPALPPSVAWESASLSPVLLLWCGAPYRRSVVLPRGNRAARGLVDPGVVTPAPRLRRGPGTTSHRGRLVGGSLVRVLRRPREDAAWPTTRRQVPASASRQTRLQGRSRGWAIEGEGGGGGRGGV